MIEQNLPISASLAYVAGVVLSMVGMALCIVGLALLTGSRYSGFFKP